MPAVVQSKTMVTDPTARTLYDDWKARRERLAQASGGAAGHQAVEMRLLDYLLRRYQDSPEAARPARFPLPPICSSIIGRLSFTITSARA